jgi:alpha-ketoglutaric semialdehyde dehydrogenase
MSDAVAEVCTNAHTLALHWLNQDRLRRASLLEAIAAALDARREEVLRVASEETALTIEELAPEFARMVNTLRFYAGIVREGSWVRAAIDRARANPAEAIGPNHDLRRMLVPRGVVAVFGASNFPLAYGVCGGDTASALAAGCPVVVKEHPAHPRTGRLVHETALGAVASLPGSAEWSTRPGFVLGYVRNEDPADYSVAKALVQNPVIQAVGFTGSKKAGLALETLARERRTIHGGEDPIPVYAEMGSCNPVFVTARAAEKRGEAIARDIASSILARHGQQCTKPGLIFVEELSRFPRFREVLVEAFKASRPRRMLAPWVAASFRARLEACMSARGVSVLATAERGSDAETTAPVLLGCSYAEWVAQPALQEEVFGPASILIDTPRGMLGAYAEMPARLASAWFFEPEETGNWPGPWFRVQSGRTCFNTVTTGVRVAHSMVHGGPFPATNRLDTTAVGPFALERWCHPVCFQNAPQEALPDELKDENPLGIGRLEDGVFVPRRG